MTMKKCTLCKTPKSLDEFNNKKSSSDGKQNCCRECNKKKCKKYYANNTEHHKKVIAVRRKKQIQINRDYVYGHVKATGCVDCPEKDPCCLDFDHVKGEKIKAISVMVADGTSLETIIAEINKCEIRCSNCHRKRTSKDQGWYSYFNTNP